MLHRTKPRICENGTQDRVPMMLGLGRIYFRRRCGGGRLFLLGRPGRVGGKMLFVFVFSLV